MALTKIPADLVDFNKSGTTKSLTIPNAASTTGTTVGSIYNNTTDNTQRHYINSGAWRVFVATSTGPALEYLVVGGGGAGNYGGGGAGGYLTNVGGTAREMTSPAVYTITVGLGGTVASSGNDAGNSGGQSIISESGSAFATVDGGGGGGGAGGNAAADAKDGGSGGGGGFSPTTKGDATGVGTGNDGGTGQGGGIFIPGGGGGAGAVGR